MRLSKMADTVESTPPDIATATLLSDMLTPPAKFLGTAGNTLL